MTTILRIGIVLMVAGILIQQFVALDISGRRKRKAERILAGTADHLAHYAAIEALPEPDWSLPVYVKSDDEQWADFMADRPWTRLGGVA